MKKRRIIILAVISILIIYLFDAFYVPYREIKIEYLGNATGGDPEMFLVETDEWTKRHIEKYAYNNYMGYFTCLGEYILHHFNDFQFNYNHDIDEDQRYVMSYGYPIKSLQYTKEYKTKRDKGYYSRAKMDVENYQEGVWFIYEMEDIHLGNMIYEEVDYIEGIG